MKSGDIFRPARRIRMSKLKVLTLFICLVLSVPACQSKSPALPPVLSDNTCAPPCWGNISPGKTTEADVRKILQDISSVKKDSIFSRPYKEFNGIYWKFSEDGDGDVLVENGIVWSLDFSSPLNESLNVTLDQAIEVYGEPAYVFSQFNPDIPDWGAVTFIYPKKGVIFSYASHVEKYKYKGVLRPETPINSISYFSPEKYQEIFKKSFIDPPEWTAEIVHASIYPWKGYGNISEKYPTAFGKKQP